MYPADGETGVGLKTPLAWSSVLPADSYEVFVGTSSGALVSVAVTTTGILQFPLQPSSTYYWRVDQTLGGSTTTGTEVQFSTRNELVVTTAVDEDAVSPGTGLSLREALAIADSQPGFDRIIFDPALDGAAITLVNGLLALVSELEIDATLLPRGIAVDGNLTSRLVEVDPIADVRLAGMRLVRGRSGGSIIDVSGRLLMDDCEVRANTVINGFSSAVLLCNSSSSTVLTDCEFHDNRSDRDGGAVKLLSGATMTISSCRFSHNSAQGSGGALHLYGARLTLYDSTFSGNYSDAPTQAASGAAIYSTSSTLTIVNCTFCDNSASGGRGGTIAVQGNVMTECIHTTVTGGASMLGGGISVQGSGSFMLANSIVAGNRGRSSPDLYVDPTAFSAGGPNLIGDNSSVETLFPQGPLVGTHDAPLDPRLSPLGSFGGSTPTRFPQANSPAVDAGSLLIGGPLTDQRGSDRLAGAAPDLGAVECPDDEGMYFPAPGSTGISIEPMLNWFAAVPATSFTVWFGADPGNLAVLGETTDAGWPVPQLLPSATYYWQIESHTPGGTIAGPVLSFTTSAPLQVETNMDDVGAGEDSGLALREALALAEYNGGPDVITFSAALDGQSIDLAGCPLHAVTDVTVNASDLPQGITIDANGKSGCMLARLGAFELIGLTMTGGEAYQGGGVYCTAQGSLLARSCRFVGNHATRSGGGFMNSFAGAEFDGCAFETNLSDTYGGALDNNNYGTVEVHDSSFTANRCQSSGGAFSNSTNEANIILNSTFVSNSTAKSGGAIYTLGALEVNACIFEDNEINGYYATTSREGGTIYVGSTGTCAIHESVISGSSEEARYGGAVHSRGLTTVFDSTIHGNSAYQGGALYATGTNTTLLVNSTISGNAATSSGGAVYLTSGATVSLNHCTLTGNQAPTGGGIATSGTTTVTLTNSAVANNDATSSGNDWSASSSVLSALGNNLVGDNSTVESTFPAGPLAGTSTARLDPLLAPLGDYGGPTLTKPPLPGSPVIEGAVAVVGIPATDQRGNPRPSGPLPDIGAVEAGSLFLGKLADTDGDAIPDLLEGPGGPYPQFTVGTDDSALDSDGDGSPDAEEIANMTDPGNPSDRFRILGIAKGSGFDPVANPVFRVTVATFPGLGYEFESSPTLSNFQPLDSFVAEDFASVFEIPLAPGSGFIRARRSSAGHSADP